MIMKNVLAVLLLSLITAPLHADGLEIHESVSQAIEQLDLGIDLLEQRPDEARQQIAAAAAMIERVIQTEHVKNPKLYHALGNVYMLTDQLGYAILAYRRGLQLDPTDPILNDSLEHARSLVPVETSSASTSRYWNYALFWRPMVSRRTLWIAFLVSMNLGFVCWSFALLKHPRRRIMFVGVTLLLISVLPLGMLSSEWYFLRIHHEIVLTQDHTIARAGPDDRIYEPVFSEPLPAGVEADRLDARDGWSHIKLHDGSECWVPSSAIEPINPDIRQDSNMESIS